MKWYIKCTISVPTAVTLSVRVWIEIARTASILRLVSVTLSVRVWIEI